MAHLLDTQGKALGRVGCDDRAEMVAQVHSNRLPGANAAAAVPATTATASSASTAAPTAFTTTGTATVTAAGATAATIIAATVATFNAAYGTGRIREIQVGVEHNDQRATESRGAS